MADDISLEMQEKHKALDKALMKYNHEKTRDKNDDTICYRLSWGDAIENILDERGTYISLVHLMIPCFQLEHTCCNEEERK